MTALRRGDTFIVDLDLPGVVEDDVELTVERNVVTTGAAARRLARKATKSSLMSAPTASSPGSCSWVTTSTPAG